MIHSKTVAAFLCAAAMLFTSAVRADQPNGSYYQDFTGIVPMWDITGNYGAGLSDLGTADINIMQDAYGNISGDGTLSIDVYGTSIDCSVTPSGKVKNDQVSLTLLISGEQWIYGNDISVMAVAKLKLKIDAPNSQMVGGGNIRARAKNLTTGVARSASQQIPSSSMALPPGADGGWTLSLNLAPNGNLLNGTATATTTPGNSANFTATGSYSATSDTAKVTLAGTGSAVGTKLTLLVSTAGTNVTFHAVSGKLFGQTPKYKAP